MNRSSSDRDARRGADLRREASAGGLADARLRDYLRRVRRRELTRTSLGFACALVVVLTLGSGIGILIGLEIGFAPGYTNAVRALLVVSALAAFVWLLWRPLRALRRDGGIELVEAADAAFDGRIRTWDDTRERAPNNPFVPILARDGLSIARRVPPARVVRSQDIAVPLFALSLAIASVVLFVQRAPDSIRDAGLHLWWGWYQDGLVERRGLDLRPGDAQLLAGENLEIEARLSGFDREAIELAVRSEGDDWQRTEIRRGADGVFRYTLYSLDAPLEYRVSAGLLESDTHVVDVTAPPRVLNVTAEYSFPEWTRLADRRDAHADNLAGVRDTEIRLSFETDRPIEDGFLQVGDRRLELRGEGTTRTAELVILRDEEYRLMARMLGREVALTPAYGVVLRGDDPPEVRWSRPGRDVSATPVEEIRLGLVAEDDFAVESIELLYSVNAGDWQSIELEPSALATHVFMLESMGLPPADGPSDVESRNDRVRSWDAPRLDGRPLEPGDLVSYYARVRDRDNVVETDMMLVDIRPFDRRFSEGDAGAGGGGGGGGGANEGSEISKRQKEILIATWNLLRARESGGGSPEAETDNAALLAELQITLAQQARTLADRSEARELVDQGDEIRRFVEYLREAADTMQPSADRLSALDFEAAIQPQQRALQLLQRAEALFADIRVTRPGEQSGGGGGSQPGQDMAEMFELEMDLERNQYERPDRGQAEQSPAEAIDDVFEELAELARRQQALEEVRANRPEATREEEWQQAQLERELADLQERLDEAEARFGADRIDEQVEGENPSADARTSQNREDARQNEAGELALRDAIEQLEAARDALEAQRRAQADAAERTDGTSTGESADASSNDAGTGGDGEADSGTADASAGEDDVRSRDPASATNDASTASVGERLADALDVLAEERGRDLARRIRAAAELAAAVLDEQRASEVALREAVERARQAREDGQLLPGLDRDQARELAERKRALQRDLDATRGGVAALLDRFEGEAPRTTAALRDAIRALDRSQISMMLGLSGDAIENGSFATALPGESLVTNAAREWRDRLLEAADTAADEGLQRDDGDAERLATVLGELRRLRQALSGSDPGDASASADRSTETGGDASEGGAGEGDAQARGADRGGQPGEGSGDTTAESRSASSGGSEGQGVQTTDGRRASAAPDATATRPAGQGGGVAGLDLPEDGRQRGFTRDADPVDPDLAAESIERLLPDLDGLGASEDDLEALADSVDRLRQGGDGVGVAAERLEREYANALRLIEQLELEFSGTAADLGIGSRDGDRDAAVPELAAEYYRRLSERARTVER